MLYHVISLACSWMNRTQKDAEYKHGKNPQLLVSKLHRQRIYDSRVWKFDMFGLDEVEIVETAASLTHVGGCIGLRQTPSPFIALLLRMLQFGVSEEIAQMMVDQMHLKYLRVLAAVYIRLVASPVRVYNVIDMLLQDFRRIRVRNNDGDYEITTIDTFVESLLYDTSPKGIDELTLPRLPWRVKVAAENPSELSSFRHSILHEVKEDNA